MFTQDEEPVLTAPQKQALIDQMVDILRKDSVWSWGYFPYASAAVQHWVYNSKTAILNRDHGRYLRLDVDERQAAHRPRGTSRSGGR